MKNVQECRRGSRDPLWIVIIIALALSSAACSAAGPYVTSVTPLEGGAIKVRRCMLEHRWAPVGDSVREGTCTDSVLWPPKEGTSRVLVLGKDGGT